MLLEIDFELLAVAVCGPVPVREVLPPPFDGVEAAFDDDFVLGSISQTILFNSWAKCRAASSKAAVAG